MTPWMRMTNGRFDQETTGGGSWPVQAGITSISAGWLCPLVCMSAYLYGPRPVLLCLVALLTGNLCDRLVAVLRRRVYRPGDWSNESFALVIALLMPATVSWYVLVTAVMAGVLLGKEAFGGYGSYPFHPAAVGFVVVAVSWPEQVFLYPQPLCGHPPVGHHRGEPGQRHGQHPAQRGPADGQLLAAGAGRVRGPAGHRRGADPAGLRLCSCTPRRICV